MRKSGWAAAGLGSLILLLSACGGSGSSTSVASSTSQSTSASQGTSAPSSGAATPTTGASNSNGPTSSTPTPHNTAGPQPSSGVGNGSVPPVGTTVLGVRRSAIGYVLAEASGYVVYTYAKDPKGGTPTCTGSCASAWGPVTGMPQVAPGEHISGTFALVTTAGGKRQITYNGYPLYIYKLAGPLVTTGNGVGGVWHVVMMSASNIG
jgi:predicted lipoprotein with Yx(FWY)xxD motif